MRVARDELLAWLDAELEVAGYRDYGPNGLQVVGRRARWSAWRWPSPSSLDVFERAGAAGAQLLIVHHGLFWDGASPVVRVLGRRRLEALFRHDLTLAAYHLPLDAHPELGNNAGLMEVLGIAAHEPFAEARGRFIGRQGRCRRRSTSTRWRRGSRSALGSHAAGVPRRASARCGRVGAISGAAGRESHGAGGGRPRLLRDRRAGGGPAVPRAPSSACT